MHFNKGGESVEKPWGWIKNVQDKEKVRKKYWNVFGKDILWYVGFFVFSSKSMFT